MIADPRSARLPARDRARILAVGDSLRTDIAGANAVGIDSVLVAGGIVGAVRTAAMGGFDKLITFDMGGTSTDVALCPGELPVTSEGEIAGMPMRSPV